jgi:hypothetical protein
MGEESSIGLLGSNRVDSVVRFAVPEATEWQRIGDEIDATFIFTGANFVYVDANA